MLEYLGLNLPFPITLVLVVFSFFYLIKYLKQDTIRDSSFTFGKLVSSKCKKIKYVGLFWDKFAEPFFIKQFVIIFTAINAFLKGLVSDNENTTIVQEELNKMQDDIKEELEDSDDNESEEDLNIMRELLKMNKEQELEQNLKLEKTQELKQELNQEFEQMTDLNNILQQINSHNLDTIRELDENNVEVEEVESDDNLDELKDLLNELSESAKNESDSLNELVKETVEEFKEENKCEEENIIEELNKQSAEVDKNEYVILESEQNKLKNSKTVENEEINEIVDEVLNKVMDEVTKETPIKPKKVYIRKKRNKKKNKKLHVKVGIDKL